MLQLTQPTVDLVPHCSTACCLCSLRSPLRDCSTPGLCCTAQRTLTCPCLCNRHAVNLLQQACLCLCAGQRAVLSSKALLAVPRLLISTLQPAGRLPQGPQPAVSSTKYDSSIAISTSATTTMPPMRHTSAITHLLLSQLMPCTQHSNGTASASVIPGLLQHLACFAHGAPPGVQHARGKCTAMLLGCSCPCPKCCQHATLSAL